MMNVRSFTSRSLALSVGAAMAFGMVSASEAKQVRRSAHVNVNHHVNVKNVKKNVNVNAKKNVNVNVKRNVNVHHDVHSDWDRYHYHPVATGVAVGAAAAVTAAVVGSVVYSLPSGCGYQTIHGVRYYQCGGDWYEQRYSGSQLTYVVVPSPY